MGAFSKIVFRKMGWKIEGSIPNDVPKAVMVIAPHTSLWDFILGRMAFNILKRKASFIIKKEFFFFPLGPILKSWGGISIDREKGSKTYLHLKEYFNKREKLILIVTPEGTRKPVARWKRGFYFIAEQSKVPIILGSLDYKRKIAFISPPIKPTGDYKEDLKIIKGFYKLKTGKFPEKFNPDFI